MTAISILSGTYTDESADWRGAMPINKEPVIGDNGVSRGYLGTIPGIVQWASGYGPDRGAINWNGTCYRVMGSTLLSVASDGNVTTYGDVGNDGLPVSMDYSFDRLAITSNLNMFYLSAAGILTQVTDVDLGKVFDVMFIDGRFMMTDGTYLVITELADPTAIDPLKYGSAETDPDPIQAICKVRNEVYALGQYTIQNFQDIGGAGFPFTNNPGGMIPRGIAGRKTWCYFNESFAFVGCGRREQPTVFIAGAGQALSISTQEVDKLLAALTPAQIAAITMEQRNEQNEQRLYVHLPDQTLVYMNQASIAAGQAVWITLRDGVTIDQPYSARNMVPCYGKWVVGSPTGQIGYLTEDVMTRWGVDQGWQFQTDFIYNASKGGIVHRLELVGLTGRGTSTSDNKIFLSSSIDGELWGVEMAISSGKAGERAKRLVWWPNRRFASFISFKFRGTGNNHSSFTRLEAEIEQLAA
jgi:hypothetical protein